MAALDSSRLLRAGAAAEHHLQMLAGAIGARPVGSTGNRRAQAYVAGVLGSTGCEVEQQWFDCWDWQVHDARLVVDGAPMPVLVNPYAPPCRLTAPLVVAATQGELDAAELAGRIVLLHGAFAQEALTPKRYPFYQVPEHQAILERLEASGAAAVILVSPRTEDVAPLIEDGDFVLPSVTVAAGVGAQLARHAGAVIDLQLATRRAAARSANVVGYRCRGASSRIVVCAHMDTKPGTPGALDNAAGVAVLLALAELLAGSTGPAVELVAFNGEDHYAAPGQVLYLAQPDSNLPGMRLLANIDGVGLRGSDPALSAYNLPADLAATVALVQSAHPAIVPGEQWVQGDHAIFWMQGVPCLAFTSTGIEAHIDTLIHTERDVPAGVDALQLGAVACLLADVIAAA